MGETIELEVPDELHRKLELRAAETGRSLSDYMLDLLHEIAAMPPEYDLEIRRAYDAREVPEKILEGIRDAKMDERHNPLNKLIDD